MKAAAWQRHRLLNTLQSLLLLATMAAILAGLGWILAGATGAFWALAGGVVLVLLNPGVSPRLVLRMYGARRLQPREIPVLHQMLAALAQRAELTQPPELYYVPSRMLNAFAVGSRSHAAVAVTDALLRTLSQRELAGVLAHEVSHIRNNDMWVMGLADLISRMTGVFSAIGQVLLLLNLPLIVFTNYSMSWTAILVLIFAPTLSGLIQLALSRTREYDADLGAAELTADPRGLAMALDKMARYQGGFLEQIIFPGRRVPDPSLLRTHPPNEDRIRRLLELSPDASPLPMPDRAAAPPRLELPTITRRPRWRINGIWY